MRLMTSMRVSIVALCAVAALAAPAYGQNVEPTVLQSFRANFERNVGQAAPDAVFVAHDAGYDLVLTRGAGVIRSDGHRDLRILFSGGDATVSPVGEEQSSGVVNYLRGNEPARWHRNITTFQRVTYPRVYPGIDVVYHASQGQMEYDIVVDAGADPEQVRMRFDGADRVALRDSGDLAVHIDDRIVTVKRPARSRMDAASTSLTIAGTMSPGVKGRSQRGCLKPSIVWRSSMTLRRGLRNP